MSRIFGLVILACVTGCGLDETLNTALDENNPGDLLECQIDCNPGDACVYGVCAPACKKHSECEFNCCAETTNAGRHCLERNYCPP
jgi:hypothetical protein